MRSRAQQFRSVLVAALLSAVEIACENQMLVGEFSTEVSSGGVGGAGSGGGMSSLGGGGSVPALFSFRTGFETGDDSEFRAVGRARLFATGALEVRSSEVFAGSYSLVARLENNSDQALELLEIPPKARVGAHYYIPADYQTADWVLMKFRTREGLPTPSADVFDIDVNRVAAGEYRIVLWEHGVGEIAQANTTFFEKNWVHIEAEFTASTAGASNGRLVIFADGVQLIDTGLRATIESELASTFAVGSVADWISPLPAEVFIDDVHVDELP